MNWKLVFTMLLLIVINFGCARTNQNVENLSDTASSTPVETNSTDTSTWQDSENESDDFSNDGLVGTWRHKSIAKTEDGKREPLKKAAISWTFNEDGTGTYEQVVRGLSAGSGKSSFRWEIKDKDIILTPGGSGLKTTYTMMKRSGDVMVWKNNRLGDFYIVEKQ